MRFIFFLFITLPRLGCIGSFTAIFVGETKKWLPELIERARKLKVTGGLEPDADIGPLISPQSKQRVETLIQSGVDEGADLVLDGRNPQVPDKYKNGNFVGMYATTV